MNLWREKKKGPGQKALSVILALCLMMTPFSSISPKAEAEEASPKLDIGLNADSVWAELSADGVLSITGAGETRNFTPGTAPFASWNIRSVEIGSGITTLGDYLFYNCSLLSGELVLPDGLYAIGQGAFSGDSREKAPSFSLIRNEFTQCIVVNQPAATTAPEATPAPAATPAPTATPGTDPASETSSPKDSSPAEENVTKEKETSAAETSSQGEKAEETKDVPAGTGEETSSGISQEKQAPTESEPAKAEQTPSAESSTAPTPSPTPKGDDPASTAAPAVQKEGDGQYELETLTQQRVGDAPFFPGTGEGGCFLCSAENQSFRDAALQAGYVESEGTVSVAFDCGKGNGGTVSKELSLAKGAIVLPGQLFTPPEGGALYGYSFAGWTESQDEANVVRAPGTRYETGDREDLYFIAVWNQQVIPELQVERGEDSITLTVPEIPGYSIRSVRWETAEHSEEKLSWKAVSGEENLTYTRKYRDGDENRLFRCVLTVEKQSFFSFFSMGEEVALAAVDGAQLYANTGTHQITFEKGAYNGTAAGGTDMSPVTVAQGDYGVIPACAYTSPQGSGSNVVFNGWVDDGGTVYDPGQMVNLTGDLRLTAQWAEAAVVFVSGSGNDSNDGSSSSSPVRNIATGVGKLSDAGTKYTNILVVCGNINLSGTLSKNMTITNVAPSETCTGTVTLSGDVQLGADVCFRDITLAASSASLNDNRNLFAQGHQAYFGENVTVSPEYALTVYGGNYSGTLTANTRVLAISGSYLAMYGGSLNGSMTGNTSVQLGGTAKAGGLIGAGWYGACVVTGNTEVIVSGSAQAAAIAGGNRDSNNSAGVTGTSHVVVGGNARIEDTDDIQTRFEFQSIGFVGGSGCDASSNNETSGNVRSGAKVEIRENAYVAGNVFGGSGDGWASNPDASHPDWLGTKGGTTVIVAGNPTIQGSVFGGGNKRACQGASSVTVEGGVIRGSVYGGGSKAHNSGTTSSSQIVINDGEIGGSVYGGGDQGNLGGSSEITVNGGTISGYVYGGGYGGDVSGNSTVTLNGGTVTGSVYGGGENGAVAGNAAVTLNGATVQGTVSSTSDQGGVFGGGNAGTIGGISTLTVKSGSAPALYLGGKSGTGTVNGSGESVLTLENGTISGSVYGGGAAGDLTACGSAVLISGGEVSGSVYGGGMKGSVAQNARVEVSGNAVVSGSVYGGGMEGSVGGNAQAQVSGSALVSGSVYGGGEKGAVGGNSSATLSGGDCRGNLYGGSKGVSVSDSVTGTVSGSSSAQMTGGSLGDVDGEGNTLSGTGNLFGGGEFAATTGMAQAEVGPGTVLLRGSVYGGGSQAPAGSSKALVESGEVYGSVFGAGYGLSSSSGGGTVTMTGGTVSNSVYGGGEMGLVTGDTLVTMNGGTVNFDVYGAGCGDKEGGNESAGVVQGHTQAVITGGTVRNLYGGGDYGPVGAGTISGTGSDLVITATGASSTSVEVTGGTITGSVFGGGSGSGSEDALGAVFGSTTVTVTGGTVGSGVFGGSNRSYVSGGTSVVVKADSEDISIHGTVFGGGNLPGGENAQFQEIYLVQGGAQVNVDGGGAHALAIDGSVYGSGNLTLVKGGTIKITIRNFNGELQSVQRADRADFIACNLKLVGAEDVTEAVMRKYSLSQINDLRLADQTQLRVDREARDLAAMGNYVTSGTELAVSTDEATRSTLRVYQGKKLQIRSIAGVYGPVRGVLWLDVVPEAGAQTEDIGISIQASADTDYGDGGVTGTGAFVKANTPESQDLPLVSGLIEGSHTFWRLGSAVTQSDLNIQAVHEDNGGTGLATQSFTLSTSGESSKVVISQRKQTGSFFLVQPTEGENGEMTALPEFTGEQTAGNTFALRVDATDSGSYGTWTTQGDGAYVLTADDTQTGGVPGVWKRGSGYPITSGSGEEGEITLTLLYTPNFNQFTGGTVELTFEEYPADAEMTAEHLESVTVLTLTIEGDGGSGVSREAYGAAGRKFTAFTGDAVPEILGSGAVSGHFVTQYYPVNTGPEGMSISLYSVPAEGEMTQVNFPAGTNVVLCDCTHANSLRYFSAQASGESALNLSAFSPMGNSGTPGPTDNTGQITEKLTFALDFSQVAQASRLSAGNYLIRLRHTARETAVQGASFTVAPAQAPTMTISAQTSGNVRAFSITLTPTVSALDTRYARGGTVRLKLSNALTYKTVGFPGKVKFTGAEGLKWGGDGSVSLPVSITEPTEFVVDFTGVTTDILADSMYEIRAELRPKPGLQSGDDKGSADCSTSTTVRLRSGSTAKTRSLRVSLSSGERIMNLSEGSADLSFELKSSFISGDSVVAEIYKKTGKDPKQSSYSAIPEDWCTIASPSSASTTATLTVPRGTPSGTYRVVFRIVDVNGGDSGIEEPFNFIVE